MIERPDSDFELSGHVGDGRQSRSADLLWLRAALTRLGRHGPTHRDATFIECELDDAVRNYQRDRGLRVDGYLRPGGPTYCCLCFDLASLEDD